MALPGLGSAVPSAEQLELVAEMRQITLAAATEWRFETSASAAITVKLLAPTFIDGEGNQNQTNAGADLKHFDGNTAEVFGTELAPDRAYLFSGGVKAAIYTHHGCTLSVTGDICESEYVAEETPMTEYTNLHFALETMRDAAAREIEQLNGQGTGPRVLVLGPDNAGKTSLIKVLAGYAIRSGHNPMVVNLDPREPSLGLPGSISATVLGSGSVMDPEDAASGGWGNTPIAGPSTVPVKMPLVYHYGYERPDDRPDVFKPLLTHMALAVTSRLEDDPAVKETGLFIDLTGKTGMETVAHVVSEFSANVILVLGSERLFSDVSRRFSSAGPGEEAIDVIKVTKSGGCVDRDESYMQALRHASTRNYFFGSSSNTLSPHTQILDQAALEILRINDPEDLTTQAFLPGGLSDEVSATPDSLFQSISPSMGLQHASLAIKHVSRSEPEETIRDASIAGYLYVADVDETKKKVKILSPVGGKLPDGAIIWGRWPEAIADLLG